MGATGSIGSAESVISSDDGPAEIFELYYSLKSSIHSARLDTDLWAGGKLLMTGLRATDGALHLSLIRAIEAPWKFYWLDRLGPGGEETKLASVVTLQESSWDALELAREKNSAFGAEVHRQWQNESDNNKSLDGAFAFVVIGDPHGRFEVTTQSSGEVKQIRNQLTDRWLSGPFDQWIGTWGNPSVTENSAQGYWFWNNGEALPFSYEPHTYHALEAALRFLSQPLPNSPLDQPDKSAIFWDNPLGLAFDVLETLAPKFRRRTNSDSAVPVSIDFDRQNSRTLAAIIQPNDGLKLHRTVQSSEGWNFVTEDRVEVEIQQPHQTLNFTVGYRPSEQPLSAAGGTH